MTAQSFAALFTALTFALALAIYLIFLQWRRLKYRKLADALGAQYQSQGLTNTGEIIGSENGRKYTIDTKAAGRSGMWTIASLECVNRGISLSIYGGFFKAFPDWKCIFMKGDGSDSASGIKIALLNADRPLEEKYKLPVQDLFREMAFLEGQVLKKGHLRIDQDRISFTQHGVLMTADVVRQIISQLTELARRIESEPVL